MDLVRMADLWEENQESLKQALGHSGSDRLGARWVLTPEIPVPKFNHLSRVRVSEPIVDDLIRECRSFFRIHHLPSYCIMTTPATRPSSLVNRLLERGFMRETEPVMFWEGTQVEQALGEVRIEYAPPSHARQVYDVIREVFFEGVPDSAHNTLRRGVEVTYSVGATYYLAYWRAQVAGVGMLFCRGEMGGIYNMGTLRPFRGRGVARMLLSRCLSEARRQGCASVGLTPTAMGRPLYERMGFREAYRQHYFSKMFWDD